jgi:hypothetical protein
MSNTRGQDDPPSHWGEDWNEPEWLKKGRAESNKRHPANVMKLSKEDFAPLVAKEDVLPELPAKKNNNTVTFPARPPELIIRRNWMDWAALAEREPPARAWIISHWLSYNPTLCAGRGGIGKTLLAQQIATALALQLPFVDEVERPMRTLMWSCEDDHDELWRRQVAICAHFERDLAELKDRLVIDARYGCENELFMPYMGACIWTSLMAELSAQVNDHRAEVVILDNVAQIFGANENDRHQVTQFVNGLCGLGQGRSLAIIVLAHPARALTSEYSGSSAWENACRMRWFLGDRLPDRPEDEAQSDERYLAKRKVNYTERDFRRFLYRDGVLVPDSLPDCSGGTGHDLYMQIKRKRVQDAVLSAVEKLAARNLYASEFPTSHRGLPKLMIDYDLHAGHSKHAITRAMRDLIITGRLQTEMVRSSTSRHGIRGLVIKGAPPPPTVIPFPYPDDKGEKP